MTATERPSDRAIAQAMQWAGEELQRKGPDASIALCAALTLIDHKAREFDAAPVDPINPTETDSKLIDQPVSKSQAKRLAIQRGSKAVADDLVQRLRGIYTVPVNDGCGPLNASMTHTRTFEVPPIHHEAADALRESDWRPIESAPKDGTDIMLGAGTQSFRDKLVPARVTVGHWTTEEECRICVGDCGGECRCPEYDYSDPWWLSWDGGFTAENAPTHWMPLPPPPAIDAARKEGV